MRTAGALVIRCSTIVAASVFAIGTGVVWGQATDEGVSMHAGHETFLRLCSACHTPDLVRSKRLSREGWDEVVQMMIGRGASGTEAELAEVVDYLASTYPPKNVGAPARQ